LLIFRTDLCPNMKRTLGVKDISQRTRSRVQARRTRTNVESQSEFLELGKTYKSCGAASSSDSGNGRHGLSPRRRCELVGWSVRLLRYRAAERKSEVMRGGGGGDGRDSRL